MNALAITLWTSTPDELAQFIPAEIKKWAQVVKDAGIEPKWSDRHDIMPLLSSPRKRRPIFQHRWLWGSPATLASRGAPRGDDS